MRLSVQSGTQIFAGVIRFRVGKAIFKRLWGEWFGMRKRFRCAFGRKARGRKGREAFPGKSVCGLRGPPPLGHERVMCGPNDTLWVP